MVREKTNTNIMNILRTLSIPAAILLLWSCAPDQYASVSEYDDIYFSSADIREINYSSLVKNNEPQNFSSFHNSAENVPMDNFSAKNVNPDYIARYANQSSTSNENFGSDDYFVEDFGNDGLNSNRNLNNQGENTTYNNFRAANNDGFGGLSPFSMGMGMGMMGGMGGFGMMNPMGMGGFGMMNPMMGMGGFGMMNPMMGMGGFGMMNPMGIGGFGMMGMGMGFNNFGFGMNSLRMRRNMMAFSFGNSPFFGGGFGNPFFMDPWMSPFGFNNFGMGGFGMGGFGMGGFGMGGFGMGGFGNRFFNPVVIINNSDAPRQQYVRGPRDGRSSQFANANSNMVPATRSADAAQRSNARSSDLSSQRRDFTQTQNEYYQNSRRSIANTSTSSSRNSASSITSNSRRGYVPANVSNSRRSSTSNYGRPTTATSRSNSVLNNSATRSRTGTSTPSRSSSTYNGGAMRSSSSSRSGGTMSGGGASRSSSGGGGSSSSGGRGGR